MIKNLFIVLISSQGLLAQNYIDVARLYFNTTAQNKFDNSSNSTRINEYGMDLTYPIVMKRSTLLTGVMAESTELQLEEYEPMSRLSSYTVRFGFNMKHSEKWSGTYLVIPKLASDFGQSTSGSFQVGALGLLKCTKTDYLNYKVGLYYNSELFGPFFVPLFGLYYGGSAKKLEVSVLLPMMVDFNYRIVNWMNVGLNFTGQIKSYRLSDVLYNSPTYVTKTSNEICGYFKFNFSKNIMLYSKIGYSVIRTYKVFDDGDKIDLGISLIRIGDERTQLNKNFSNGLLYQTVLVYRFIQD